MTGTRAPVEPDADIRLLGPDQDVATPRIIDGRPAAPSWLRRFAGSHLAVTHLVDGVAGHPDARTTPLAHNETSTGAAPAPRAAGALRFPGMTVHEGPGQGTSTRTPAEGLSTAHRGLGGTTASGHRAWCSIAWATEFFQDRRPRRPEGRPRIIRLAVDVASTQVEMVATGTTR